MGAAGHALHGTCLIVGEAGILIRGEPGAGKSRLARALLAEAERRGLFGRLIGDDRIIVEAAGGRLLARGHPAIAGLIEARGLGLLSEIAESTCILRLIVDLSAAPGQRLPDAAAQQAEIEGVTLPRLALGPEADRPDLVLSALIRLSS